MVRNVSKQQTTSRTILFGSFVKMFSIRVAEFEVILVGCERIE